MTETIPQVRAGREEVAMEGSKPTSVQLGDHVLCASEQARDAFVLLNTMGAQS